MTFVNASVPLNSKQTRFFYAFGGYSRRDANSAGFYRRALDARNWPAIYPLGFLPEIQPTVIDVSGTGGVRGASESGATTSSGEYGHNSFAFTIGDTLNVSLGPGVPPNKTDVRCRARWRCNQFVGNVDVSRPFTARCSAGPFNVAFGAEYRRENYQIHGRRAGLVRDGGVPNQFGERRGHRRAGLSRLPAVERSRRSRATASPATSTWKAT